MTRRKRSWAAGMVDKVESGLSVLTGLLSEVSAALREIVAVLGWVVVVISTWDLLVQGHVFPDHLATSGAGALAALQKYAKLPTKHDD